MSATKPPVSKPEFSPLSITRMLWKNGSIILAVTLLGSVASFALVHQLPAIYRSEALILVDSQKIPERYVSSTVNTEVQDRLATISQEILSATRLQKIINDFGLYRDERKKLVQEEVIELMRKDISIELEKGWTGDRPGAFHIGYQGRNPRLITAVANEFASLFIEENLRTRERQAQGTADFIDSQLQQAKKTLDELEERVSNYKLAHNGDLPEQQNSLNARLASLQIELQGNGDAISRAQQNKVMLQGTLDTAEAAAGVLSNNQASGHRTGAGTAKISDPQTNLEYLQSQYDDLGKRYQPTYPRMIALRHEIERQKTVQDEERARIESLKSQIALADREIQQRTNEHGGTRKAIADLQARIERLPVREQEMAELTRDYEESKANYKSLLDKKLAAAMATDMERRQQGERFTLLDPPRVPEKPISPRTRQFQLGCVLSLALGLGLAVAKESKTNAVLGEWELPEGLDVLGRVPHIDPNPRTARGKKGRPRWKWVIVSSAVLSILVTCVAGVYFYWGRL